MRSKICYVGSLGWVVSGVSEFIARGAEFCYSVRSTFITGCVWRRERPADVEIWRPYCAGLSKCLGDALIKTFSAVIKTFNCEYIFLPQYIFLHVFTSVKWRFIFRIINGISLSLSARPGHTQLSSYFHWCSSNKSFKGHLRKRSESWRWSEAFYWKLIHSKLAEWESNSLEDFRSTNGTIFKEMLYQTLLMARRKMVCKKKMGIISSELRTGLEVFVIY